MQIIIIIITTGSGPGQMFKLRPELPADRDTRSTWASVCRVKGRGRITGERLNKCHKHGTGLVGAQKGRLICDSGISARRGSGAERSLRGGLMVKTGRSADFHVPALLQRLLLRLLKLLQRLQIKIH